MIGNTKKNYEVQKSYENFYFLLQPVCTLKWKKSNYNLLLG